ncbi:hypothetical protein RJ639_000652 [Escallonia herrerae]|uniref:PGG domain-containing protein n=1 Tax=Escallonia herrerae TaxID=1293975 RepID=A0AA89BHX6_9ASTE|nr:hypothetical protein RJ639_000652 [Escallonia herrerae]
MQKDKVEKGLMKLLSLLDEEKLERQKGMERELHEAAMEGSVTALLQLLQEDPQILNSVPTNSDTPLHVAAHLGHLGFTIELLSRKPELAGAVDSRGWTALHVASAKGYVEIARELLLVSPDSCLMLDRGGRSALHLAAIKGRVRVLSELVRVKPEVTRVLTGGGETCLHLCVKYNRLEGLKALVDGAAKKEVFVNWKDQGGNTILHLAVAKKQIEIIKYLLVETEVDVNARNGNGFTALDVLSRGPRDLRDMEIKQCLNHVGATIIRSTPSILSNGVIEKVSSITGPHDPEKSIIEQEPKKHKHTDWLGRKRNSLMIVASLLATVAFQASISPPGGVWQDDYAGISNSTMDTNRTLYSNSSLLLKPHEAGQSVMAFTIPRAYGQFMIFNTIAFLASLSIILLLVSGLPMKRRRWMWTQMVTMWIALSALAITYFITLINMTPDRVAGTLFQVTKISVLGWMTLMAIVIIGNVVRVMRYLLRKYGYMEDKEREPVVYEEEDEKDEL